MGLNLLENQAEQRDAYLRAIIDSPAKDKLIVAGPGTGKTYTFDALLKEGDSGDKLALTFIRRLVHDMRGQFGEIAEVKTFHAYCKRLLHERYGGIELAPYLNQVMREDASALEMPPTDFRTKFQTLEETNWQIGFFLQRGDYYRAVGFDDAVYRVYREARDGVLDIPEYSQIVIDEYQDFNLLEVSFLALLAEHGPILIVGDDDQAVYRLRNSSPQHLRDLSASHEFEMFELPYCSRCPRCVVEATVDFINGALDLGNFTGRVPRRFVPYLEGKEELNRTYPRIAVAQTTNVACLSNLVAQLIEAIPAGEVLRAHTQNHPCVLIVGKKQYLNPLFKYLRSRFAQIAFTQGDEPSYSLEDGYGLLCRDENSNLGWRVVAGLQLPTGELGELVAASTDGEMLRSLLPPQFVEAHLSIIRELQKEDRDDVDPSLIEENLGQTHETILDYFFPGEADEAAEPDQNEPEILLSSFEGCKGLSAEHVFIVGVNQGETPSTSADGSIDDIEFSKFIVAMTRTRSQLYIFANRWYFKPEPPAKTPSFFISMIPDELISDFGYVRSAEISRVVEGIFPSH